MGLPESEAGTAQICRAEGQDPTSKLKVLPLQLSLCLATSPWDGQHDCDPTGGDEGTLSPLSPYPGPREGHSFPRSRIWGGMRVPVPGVLVLLLPTAVELLARGGEQAKGSMWGKPARGKIDI